MVSKPRDGNMSPMTKRRNQRRKIKKTVTVEEYPQESEDEYYTEYESSDDEEEIEWKLDAAEERCRLSDVFCSEGLLVNVALLAWSYFKDWYQRVQYGEDPYQAYEDISLLG